MNTCGGNGGIFPPFLTSALDGASRPDRVTDGETAQGTRRIRGWMGPRRGRCWEQKISWPYRESNPDSSIVQPVAELLYRLSAVGNVSWNKRRITQSVYCVQTPTLCQDLFLLTSHALHVLKRATALVPTAMLKRVPLPSCDQIDLGYSHACNVENITSYVRFRSKCNWRFLAYLGGVRFAAWPTHKLCRLRTLIYLLPYDLPDAVLL